MCLLVVILFVRCPAPPILNNILPVLLSRPVHPNHALTSPSGTIPPHHHPLPIVPSNPLPLVNLSQFLQISHSNHFLPIRPPKPSLSSTPITPSFPVTPAQSHPSRALFPSRSIHPDFVHLPYLTPNPAPPMLPSPFLPPDHSLRNAPSRSIPHTTLLSDPHFQTLPNPASQKSLS